MMTSLILKCVILAKGHLFIETVPVDEYAMAYLEKDINGTHVESTVIEGKLNSLLVSFKDLEIETMVYSSVDYDQRELSAKLSFKQRFSTVNCQIVNQ